MRITGLAALAAFLLFAAVQYNDPDPLVWIAAYGYCAVLALMLVLERIRFWPAALAAAAYIVAFFFRAPFGELRWMPLEIGREAMGLGLCAAWAAYVAWVSRKAGAKHVGYS